MCIYTCYGIIIDKLTIMLSVASCLAVLRTSCMEASLVSSSCSLVNASCKRREGEKEMEEGEGLTHTHTHTLDIYLNNL